MASVDVDDLEINPFYKALQDKYFKDFQDAQAKCYCICVPQISSLEGITITQELIDTHILKPSPFFQGQYLTDSAISKELHLEGTAIHTGEGFKRQTIVKILGEELGYNKDYKPFRLLIIERPLDTFIRGRTDSTAGTIEMLSFKSTYSENKKFLNSLPEWQQGLQSLEKSIKEFNSNYMILGEYLDDAAHKLHSICHSGTQNLIRMCRHPLKSERRFVDTLSVAVESYVLGQVHQKLFPVIRQFHRQKDDALRHKLAQIEGVCAEQLGVAKEFICPLPAAVAELANLDSLCTPLERCVTLKNTLDLISTTVNVHILDRQKPGEDGAACLTTDDLIPLLVTVIVQSRCGQIASNIFYLENFNWSGSCKDDLSYSFVTFKAAVEYLATTDFSNLKPNSSSHKQNGLEPSMGMVSESSKRAASGSEARERVCAPAQSSSSPGTSRIDRQLDRISKMLAQSAINTHSSNTLTQTNDPYVHISRRISPDVIPLKGSSGHQDQLGDFLSELKKDVLDSSYGKQS